MKVSDMKTSEEVFAEAMKNPAFRAEVERTALAHAVAMRILHYRVEHGLSQTALARILGMKQPAISRLESSDVNPSWETLAHISETLGIEFLIDIAPNSRRKLVGPAARRARISPEAGPSRFLVAAT